MAKVLKKSLFLMLAACLSMSVHAETLQEAIQCAIATNPEILVSTNDRLAIGQQLRQAQAKFLPTIDAAAGYGREQYTSPSLVVDPGTADSNTTTLNRQESSVALDQILFDGFDTYNNVTRNRARVCSAAYKLSGTSQDIALRVAKAYLDVMSAQTIVALAQDNLAKHLKLADMITKRARGGLTSDADRIQALGRVALAQSDLEAAVGTLNDATTNYIQVVGNVPGQLIQPFLCVPNFPKTLETALHFAVRNNPFLKLARMDVIVATYQHAQAYSPFMPRFDVQLLAANNRNISGVPGPNRDYQAMVRMQYNLYRGGADIAKQRETAYLWQEAIEIKNRTTREVEQTTSLSWNSLETTQAQLPSLQSHVTNSQKTVHLYQLQFQLGQRTLLDVLNAQIEYFNASQALVQAQYAILYAQYRILNNIGCLLQVLRVPLPCASHV